MSEGTARSGAPRDYTLRFVSLLDEWVARHSRLLDALVELRALDGDTEAAVAAILDVKIVRVLILSWQLWDQLVVASGDEPDRVLLDNLPRQVVEHARLALWGAPWRYPLSLVQ